MNSLNYFNLAVDFISILWDYNNITLNATALTDIKDNNAFIVCLMEYEHDHQNNGTGSWEAVLGSSASSRGLDGFHIAENGESNEPELTINYSAGPTGVIKLTSGKIILSSGKIAL